MTRAFWFIIGMFALGLGFAGAFLPLLPTTPFLLVATFAFARSSPRLHAWLLAHRHFGPLILDWQHHGAIARNVKIIAVAIMAAAFAMSWLSGFGTTVLLIQAFVLGCAAMFILTRPDSVSGPRNR